VAHPKISKGEAPIGPLRMSCETLQGVPNRKGTPEGGEEIKKNCIHFWVSNLEFYYSITSFLGEKAGGGGVLIRQ
jgi:hypothetical protein